MIFKALPPPLSNIQVELLNRYSVGVSDDILIEFKEVMSMFFMQKLREEADKVWLEKGYTEKDIAAWLSKGEVL